MLPTTKRLNTKVSLFNSVNYMPCELQCPVTYEFIEYSDNLRDKINKIISEDSEKRLS
jgi:hypothetical protein